ncbi:MAG: histidine phosphatase family protein [Geminicoccaceae bacterium]
MRICLIRHGITAWNTAGRIQGRRDIPLSDAGRAQVRSWRLPDGVAGARCVASPLRRATETAAILGFASPEQDARLVEMDWGEFEGRTLVELRDTLGPAMRELEDAGLDFRPPGGESPREVADRLREVLRGVAADGKDAVIVAHKGILRASLVLACGWRMLGKPPVRYEPERALVFRVDANGTPEIEAAVPLVAAS